MLGLVLLSQHEGFCIQAEHDEIHAGVSRASLLTDADRVFLLTLGWIDRGDGDWLHFT